MAIQHKQVIVRAEVNKPFVDGDAAKLKKWLKDLVKKIDMKNDKYIKHNRILYIVTQMALTF